MSQIPLYITAAFMLTSLLSSAAYSPYHKVSEFKVADGKFMLDKQPFIIKAAELHYPRIPRPYWDHRIKMCKALGMNTICLYVFWNVHEQEPGKFDFTGQNDLAEFIRLCEANDMKVILRPGPYVCAEWEMGGLPWWLLKNKDIRLRENDPYFLERVAIFEKEVADQVRDLTSDKGGPIIMIQVENEYGSYGVDKEYVSKIRDLLRDNYGEKMTLFQCDWSSNFLDNGLDDLVWTLNFGTGADIDEQFAPLRKVRPDSPLMCSEFWSGWFDKWGAAHETRSATDMIAGIDEMLSKDISFSLYMAHGGTNWGHWAGANSPGYSPDVTSYDYDAPINEQGAPTDKYYLLREVLQNYNSASPLPALPDTIATIEIAHIDFTDVSPLFDNLPTAISDSVIRSMEEYGQGYGSILYSTTIDKAYTAGTTLEVNDVHDFAQIFINGMYIGSLDRRNAETQLALPEIKGGSRLDILVEATGRINFGRAIKDFKGITDNVYLYGEKETEKSDFSNWEVYLLPDSYEFYRSMIYHDMQDIARDERERLPRGVYRGVFNVSSPGDTFLNFETWGKGLVYVNGHAIGRIWEIGPQQTLYMPGCWLNEGENEILVFDILGPQEAMSFGQKYPELDKLQTFSIDNTETEPDLSAFSLGHDGEFSDVQGWQSLNFADTYRGREICIEALDNFDGVESVSVAEIYLLDKNGNRIIREGWRSLWNGNQDLQTGNHGVDKIYDLQESTYWRSSPTFSFPHHIYIDLGEEYEISGIEYLPGPDSSGKIRHFKMYAR